MPKRTTKSNRRSQSRIGKGPRLRVVGVSKNGEIHETPVSRLSREERAYYRDLHEKVDEIYEAAARLEWSWSVLASNAGLSYQTVCRLGDRVTRFPGYMTIYKLATAVGMATVLKKLERRKRIAKLAKAG